jgi:DnaK suppressor protein
MNQHQIDNFKDQLLEMQKALRAINDQLAESGKTVELDQTMMGRLSRMDAMQGQQMALEASRRQKQKLLDIGAALRRIEADEFGYCVECDEEIDIRRLEADPSNSHCINCAE